MKFHKQFIYLIKIQKKIFGNKIYKNLEMVFLNFLIKWFLNLNKKMNNSQKIELLKQTIEGIRQDIEKIKNVKIKIIIKKIETKKVFERERKKRKWNFKF